MLLVQRICRARAYISSPGLGPLLARSLAGSSVVRVAAMISSFAVGVQLARQLGVQGYGYYGLALSIITIAAAPAELGLPTLVAREVAKATARNDAISVMRIRRWAEMTCCMIAFPAGALAAIAGITLMSRGSSALGLAVIAGIPMIPLLALSRINGAALQGLQYMTLGQVPANLLRPLLFSSLLLVIYFLGSITAPIAMLLNSVTAVFAYLVARAWFAQRKPFHGPVATVAPPKRWLSSIVPLGLTDGMRMLQLELTALLLGAMTVPTDVALFRVAVVVGSLTATPLAIINCTVPPLIAKLHMEQDGVRLRKVVTSSALVQTIGALLLSLPVLIWPEQLLSIVFGNGFAPAATAVRIVIAGQVVNAAFGTNVSLLNMTGHERRVTRAMIIGMLANIFAVIALVPIFGLVGASIGFVISLVCWNILTWIDGKQILSIDTSLFAIRLKK